MARLQLVIGNKNYSSWSLRPWILARQAQIPFEEVQLKFDNDVRVIGIEKYSRAGKVPVLVIDGEAVGHARDRRDARRAASREEIVASRTRARAGWRARRAPRCIRASRRCATRCR
jgi:hypothetical protein